MASVDFPEKFSKVLLDENPIVEVKFNSVIRIRKQIEKSKSNGDLEIIFYSWNLGIEISHAIHLPGIRMIQLWLIWPMYVLKLEKSGKTKIKRRNSKHQYRFNFPIFFEQFESSFDLTNSSEKCRKTKRHWT